jgi:hypothetical protein
MLALPKAAQHQKTYGWNLSDDFSLSKTSPGGIICNPASKIKRLIS